MQCKDILTFFFTRENQITRSFENRSEASAEQIRPIRSMLQMFPACLYFFELEYITLCSNQKNDLYQVSSAGLYGLGRNCLKRAVD